VRMNAPLWVPTNTLTPLILISFFGVISKPKHTSSDSLRLFQKRSTPALFPE
jgi:hypothetical protein